MPMPIFNGRFGVPGRIRTCDPKFRKLVFYPTELRARLAVPRGIEPLFHG